MIDAEDFLRHGSIRVSSVGDDDSSSPSSCTSSPHHGYYAVLETTSTTTEGAHEEGLFMMGFERVFRKLSNWKGSRV
jgi:hypothetical protein